MPASSRSKRVLLYSHDSYGLGHVSRCRTIANAIVEADSSISVLIISGSAVIGSYEFRSGIDFGFSRSDGSATRWLRNRREGLEWLRLHRPAILGEADR